MKKYLRSAVVCMLIGVMGISGCGQQKEEAAFSPKLDTDKKVVLSTAGFFGNFEALDQVTNDFNEYYPNVEFSYEQVGIDNFQSYMETNPDVDIMMTSEELFSKLGNELEDICADLKKEDIDVSYIEENMLGVSTHDGKLSAIPMGQNTYGIVVNESLLKKEGLSVPADYSEFIDTLTALKAKGYTPIQGPSSKIYAELTGCMAYDMILSDNDLYDSLISGNEDAADKLQPVFEKMGNIINSGFTDESVNQNYPDDNYDQAILNFFEGDVPFWVCNTEKVSGMKKRESKSEAFTADPFDYTFMYVPMGDKGAYAFREPWYGFSVNKNGENYDYAVEFMRFFTTKDEINKIADIKGIPSVAVQKTDAGIYKYIFNTKNIEMECVNEGKVTPKIVENWYASMNKYASGEFAGDKEAAEYFVGLCSE